MLSFYGTTTSLASQIVEDIDTATERDLYRFRSSSVCRTETVVTVGDDGLRHDPVPRAPAVELDRRKLRPSFDLILEVGDAPEMVALRTHLVAEHPPLHEMWEPSWRLMR